MKMFLSLAVVLSMMSHFDAHADTTADKKEEIKKLLKNVSREARLEAISRAEVFEKKIDKLHRESPEKIAEIDVIQELNKTCSPVFNYSDDAKTNLAWPTVNCKYHRAERVLGGSTNKFLCDFKEVDKNGQPEIKTRKVKYPAFTGMKNSELVPSLLASNIARLLGFYTELYCPTHIQCENCSSNMPYEFGNGRGRPSNETFPFENSMVERDFPGIATITSDITDPNSRRKHVLAWDEIVKIKAVDAESAKKLAIEREIWLLWINFIAEFDPNASNQKLSCDKAKLEENGGVSCLRPVMFSQDYGQAFLKRFQFSKWANYSALVAEADGTCRGGLTNKLFESEGKSGNRNELYINPIISAEARDQLVQRLRNISDKQWDDIARLSNIQRLFKVRSQDFVAAMKSKIDAVAKVQCSPFSEGKSVMFKSAQEAEIISAGEQAEIKK